MYFTKISDDSFNAEFPISKDSFIDEFSKILKSEPTYQELTADHFIGEINNNLISCRKLSIDKSGSRIMVEVRGNLIQEDENLIVKTSLNTRRLKFYEQGLFSQFMISIAYALFPLFFLVPIYFAVSQSNYQHLKLTIFALLGLLLGRILLIDAKKKGIINVTEELKKEFELAYLRAKNY